MFILVLFVFGCETCRGRFGPKTDTFVVHVANSRRRPRGPLNLLAFRKRIHTAAQSDVIASCLDRDSAPSAAESALERGFDMSFDFGSKAGLLVNNLVTDSFDALNPLTAPYAAAFW